MLNLIHDSRRTTHISDNSTQNHFVGSVQQGIFCAHKNLRRKNLPNFFRPFSIPALFLVFMLVSCDPPKSPKKPCAAGEPKGEARYTLEKNADNTTYTLTIAKCVKTITRGEFSAINSYLDGVNPVKVSDSKFTGKLGPRPEEAVTAILLPSTIKTIEENAFYNHKKVTGTFTIPRKVQSIGKGSFNQLGAESSALNITFAEPSQLTTLGEEAFSEARTSVLKLPQSLKTIGKYAFYELKINPVTTFTIPANVKSIGFGAFLDVINPLITGTLTIKSRKLNLENNLFVEGSKGDGNNFTTIKLPKEVYGSYAADKREDIFGIRGTYQDLDSGAEL